MSSIVTEYAVAADMGCPDTVLASLGLSSGRRRLESRRMQDGEEVVD